MQPSTEFQIPDFDNDSLARHLSGMVRCQTISNADPDTVDYEEFDKLHAYLKQTYPRLHRTLTRTVINGHSLLYRWEGNGESSKQPILLAAHQDVVPVAPGTEADWTYPPFAGTVADGFVWGRGTEDIKCLILGHMEAIEALIERGFVPDRDVYLAYGHDEEVFGPRGATYIAQHLKDQNLHLDMVLDEGGAFVRGEPYGIGDRLMAQVGIFEKGYLDIKLTVEDEGGHASRPKGHSALGVLARAIDAVQRHPFPASLSSALKRMYEALKPHMEDQALRDAADCMDSHPERLLSLLEKTPLGNAMVRTTAAATMAWASPAPNVLPQRAEAVFNVRVAHTETVESVVRHFKQAIMDERVHVSVLKGTGASNISETDCEAFDLLRRNILWMRPDAVVAPNPLVVCTDARKYDNVCAHTYRFGAFIGHMDLRSLVHGTDERTPVNALEEGVRFYAKLLWRFCSQEGRQY